MTREEAINQLQDAKDGYKEYLSDEALDMAIESLEKLNAIETIIDTDYVQEDVFKYKAIVNTVKENKQ